MKSIIKAICIIQCSFLFFSCNNQSDDSDFGGIVIDSPLKKEVYPDSLLTVSSIFESVDTIYLENDSAESTIGMVQDIKLSDDLIFIRSSYGLFVFNYEGKFIRRIGNKGRGPGEYLSLSKFDILKSKREVSIIDFDLNRVLVYSYEGEFLRKFDFEDFVHDFAVLPNGNYLFMNPDYYDKEKRRGLWETDPNGVFVKQLFTIPDYYKHVSINTRYLAHINPEEIGCQGLEDLDYIYHYKNDSIYPKYKIKTDIKVPRKIQKQTGRWTNPDREYTKTGYFETDRFLLFEVTNFENDVRVIYDKKKDMVFRQYSDYFGRISSLDNIMPYFNSCYEGNCIVSLEPQMVLAVEELKELYPTITADSNPILFVFKEKSE